MGMDSTPYANNTMLLWPEFIAERMAGLNFYGHCALSIDEAHELSQMISENGHKLKLLKHVQVWSIRYM